MMKYLMLLVLLAGGAFAQTPAQPGPHVRGELISSLLSVAPGDSFEVIFRQEIDPGWHTYWINPGDSGAPPDITWQTPDGVVVSEFRYPYPKRIAYGPLMNYGYYDEVLLPFDVSVPQDYDRETLTLQGAGRVLVCADICIPEKITLTLTVPVGATTQDVSTASLFTRAAALIPAPLSVSADFTYSDSTIEVTFGLPAVQGDRIEQVEFFPLMPDIIENPAEQSFSMTAEGLRLSLTRGFDFDPATADFSGLLVITENVGEGVVSSFEVQTSDGPAVTQTGPASDPGIDLLSALLFAFLGGLILNLMPCVFPVLSIKILSLVESAQGAADSIRLHGWAYTVGVVLSFVGIALLLILLRAGGEAIGWGFQLQSPIVVSLLAYLFIVIGLNLIGAFEFRLAVDDAAQQGYAGSVMTGVLATVVAAPCTAPFMGAALGFALLQSPVTGLLVFAALGLGMALPYLLLCYSPGLLSRLPRPGNWMLVLKQFLAFPMFASAIWLVWVLGIQAGPTAMMQLLGGALLIALAIWMFGQSRSLIVRLIAIACVFGALAIGFSQQTAITHSNTAGVDAINAPEGYSPAGVYSAEALASGLASGPVFVNFTAAWCITCKVNELNALEVDSVRTAFDDLGVTYLKADWTNEDPLITAALANYGRTGVPLYLLYPGEEQPAIVLPQLLTPSIVLSALEQL